MEYPTELAPNQDAALTQPCRKCGAPAGSVRKHAGRFGPWVECNTCHDKVRRPRGRAFPTTRDAESVYAAEPREPIAVAGSLEASILSLVQPHINAALGKVQVDASTVLDMVTEELSKLQQSAPTVIELRKPDAAPVTIENAHHQMPRLLRLLGAGLTTYLWGDAGTGKTTAALQAARALGQDAEIDTLDPSTFRSMVQGYRTPSGEPVSTAFTRCWELGYAYIADECDNTPGHVQTLFNSALANGHAPLAWGHVAKHDGFRFIGTGNTPGQPTRAFPDRRPMSAAFKDRLYFVHWELDASIEARACGLSYNTPREREARPVSANAWGSFVRDIREWASTNAPTLMVTPRATLLGLVALQAGETAEQVAHGLIFRGADTELVTKALNAVPLP